MKLELGLCSGRHDIPVDEYIFEMIDDPTDAAMMHVDAVYNLERIFTQHHVSRANRMVGITGSMDCPTRYIYEVDVVIYVTGLTAALIAALNACATLGVQSVTLMHFNKATGTYFNQKVVGLN